MDWNGTQEPIQLILYILYYLQSQQATSPVHKEAIH